MLYKYQCYISSVVLAHGKKIRLKVTTPVKDLNFLDLMLSKTYWPSKLTWLFKLFSNLCFGYCWIMLLWELYIAVKVG